MYLPGFAKHKPLFPETTKNEVAPDAHDISRATGFKSVAQKKSPTQPGAASERGVELHNHYSPASVTNVYLYDEFGPEDTAMMQALYSRSAASVTEHAEKVQKSGSGKFMEKFYVGYGHLSIADCGSTTLFIEHISTLGAKAIQDWPLYAGQETSTRYIDMSRQPIVDPVNTPASRQILEEWMRFYVSAMPSVEAHITTVYPRQDGQKEAVYAKAVKARAFDILRGFLPAGITTQLSWHTNLRQAWDKLSWLRHHPVDEIQTIAEQLYATLQERYPTSFSHALPADQEEYRRYVGQHHTYYAPPAYPAPFTYASTINHDALAAHADLIARRPRFVNLPHFLTEAGHITFNFLIDFGSFRDIQRHRNGVCRMPLLTTQLGFNEWYLSQLPETVRYQAQQLIQRQTAAIAQLETTPEVQQYYIAMGFNVACRVTYGLPAAVYVTELRSGRTVHPSLRKVAHKMHDALTEIYPGITLYSDLSPDDWDVRRGSQDITEKT